MITDRTNHSFDYKTLNYEIHENNLLSIKQTTEIIIQVPEDHLLEDENEKKSVLIPFL